MLKRRLTPTLKNSRKGQTPTGSQAATLIVLITLLIIFYLLFIPPDIRDQILEGDEENISETSTTTNKTLLLETPGTLEEMEEKDVEHLINAVYLFATEEAKVLERTPALSVKNSWFTKKSANLTFRIEEKKRVENVLLSFLAEDRKGILTIKFNGVEIYSGELSSPNIEPLRLKSDQLVIGTNTIEFSVSDVGWAFWRANQYQLTSVQVSADVTDTSEQESRSTFIVSTTEKNNVQRVVLKFTPDCMPGDVGRLNIYINAHSVYSSIPDCGAPTAIEFLPEILRVGENQLGFKTDKGNYLIDLIKITSEMKKSFQPVYYFDVKDEDYEDIKDDDYDITLKLTFAEGKELKQGSMIINGIETALYQTERTYEKKINDFIVKGSNSIKILPEDRLEIAKLEVIKE